VDEEIKRRKALAKKIINNIFYYKLCEGCESVIFIDSIFCPVCQGYRFEHNLDKIEQAATVLSKRKQQTKFMDDFDKLF
jgi:rRNA maturation endonuclease Nob1